MDPGGWRGGITKLRELISEHPAELAYDMRAFLGISIDDIGERVSWREAVLLVSVLLRNTDSWVQAAYSGWSYPIDRQYLAQAHTYDLLARVNSKKGARPKPYPTPFPQNDKSKMGKTSMSSRRAKELLARMNPKG